MLPIDPASSRPPSPDPAISPPLTERSAPARVGTYNIAGGNNEFNNTDQLASTTRTLAQQMVGGVDIVALQEVNVGTDRAADQLPDGFTDYNEYALAQVSAEAQGLQGDVRYTRLHTVDGSGRPTTIVYGVDAAGRGSQVSMTQEHYTSDGARLPADVGNLGFPALNATVTVYNADVVTPEGVQDYTAVFGASTARDGGDYGNAMLLGPRATLQRDADGNAVVSRHVLGHDPSSDEPRTALRAGIDLGGESTTVFSAHLTYDKVASAAVAERDSQVAALADLADSSGGNTLLLGDFNDDTVESVGALTGGNSDENRVDPIVKKLSDLVNQRDDTNIDRIYVSDDVAATDRQERVFDGGSDHEMVTWQVDLDR